MRGRRRQAPKGREGRRQGRAGEGWGVRRRRMVAVGTTAVLESGKGMVCPGTPPAGASPESGQDGAAFRVLRVRRGAIAFAFACAFAYAFAFALAFEVPFAFEAPFCMRTCPRAQGLNTGPSAGSQPPRSALRPAVLPWAGPRCTRLPPPSSPGLSPCSVEGSGVSGRHHGSAHQRTA